MIREAKAKGANFVSTPEMTNILEPDRPRLKCLARPEQEDESVAAFATLAKDLSLWLNIGSLALKGEGDKLINRSLLFAPMAPSPRATTRSTSSTSTSPRASSFASPCL